MIYSITIKLCNNLIIPSLIRAHLHTRTHTRTIIHVHTHTYSFDNSQNCTHVMKISPFDMQMPTTNLGGSVGGRGMGEKETVLVIQHAQTFRILSFRRITMCIWSHKFIFSLLKPKPVSLSENILISFYDILSDLSSVIPF